MTIIQKLQARRIIARVARLHGVSTGECRAAIQGAITEAWATSDPEIKQRQFDLIGEERIPTPEEIILVISQKIS